jgi:hypothetical protein
VPTKFPPHVPPTVAENPAFGVTVKVVLEPLFTFCVVVGEMLPFVPALGVTTKTMGEKFATTVQFATTAFVV